MTYIKLASILIITATIITNCKKEKMKIIGIKDFYHSDCKNSSSKTFLGKPETITLKTINENELKITRENVIFNCCPGELKAETTITGDTLKLKEYSAENSCNCVCLYDLEYTIKNLEYSNFLFLITTKDYYESYRFKFNFDFNSKTDTTIIIN